MQKQFVLKARETVKRVAAITAGATLLGATAMGAVAAGDLGDYPAPFVTDGDLVGKIVLGSTAVSADTAGAVNIMTTLAQAAVTTVAGTGTTEVTGGIAKEFLIGTALSDQTAWSSGIDDDDLSGLLDTTINIDIGSNKDYDVHEAIIFTSGASIETGSTTASISENFGTDTFLELAKDSIKYRYIFDDTLEAGNRLNDTTTSNIVALTILGQDLEISGATDTTITVSAATEHYMAVGDTVNIDGQTITLIEVSSGAVVVDVDGVHGVVGTTTKTVNGIKIQGQEFFNKEAVGAGSATIKIGADISNTYKNNEAYIGEDTDDPNWVWEIGNLSTATPTINVSWDQVVDDSDDAQLISVENGGKITLPNDYAQIYLNKYTVEDRQEYKVTIETGLELNAATGSPISDVTNGQAIHFEAVGASGDDAFTLFDKKSDDIWLYFNKTGDITSSPAAVYIYYWNTSNNKIVYSGRNASNGTVSAFNLTFKDTSVNVHVNASSGNATEWNWTIDDEGGHGDITLNTEISSNAFEFLGETTGDTTVANDLKYNNTDISGWKQDTRTERGFIISSYYETDSTDEFSFSVPGDNADYDVEVIVSGKASAVSTTGGTTVPSDLSAYDSVTFDDVVDKTSGNLILVGGPAVNSLTAEALGLEFPTSGAASTIPEGKAILKWIDNAFGGSNTVLIVAGWEAAETQAAASVLQAYSTYSSDLDGKTSVVVDGTTVTAVGADTTAE